MNIKEKLQGKNITLKGLLLIIAIGVWVIALQNLGVLPINQKVKVVETVRIVGDVDANVSGSVSVDNTVDVNLDEVLGYPVGCRRSYTIDGREYQAIDVSIR